jgi:hypothetical protein
MKIKPVSVLLITTFAAGCGGTSDSVQQAQSYGELVALFDQIDAVVDLDNPATQPFDPAALPTSGGNVTYTGVLGANLDDGAGGTDSLIGQMNLTANFQDSEISGNVVNFVDVNSATYTGQLAIGNGVIDRGANVATQFTITADLTGDLNSTTAGAVNFATTLDGDFYGANYENVGGQLNGNVTSATGTTAVNGDNSYFLGER